MILEYSARAEADLDAIFAYMDQRNPNVAAAILRTIRQRASKLKDHLLPVRQRDDAEFVALQSNATRTKFIIGFMATRLLSCTFATVGALLGPTHADDRHLAARAGAPPAFPLGLCLGSHLCYFAPDDKAARTGMAEFFSRGGR